ncbi:hypothetical protein HYR99_16390 [Candidatus Poribacteria bacterium]|nr:hypothetical protein [Candidatus Poribacteria bacterium]
MKRKKHQKPKAARNRTVVSKRAQLSLAMLGFSGAVTAGFVTSFFFSGWGVAIATLLGGVCGLFVSAFCWVAQHGK